MYTLIYFSPTGNTRFLAKELAKKMEISSNQVFELEFVKYDEITFTERMIIMYPIHGFNAPRTVKRFIKNMPANLSNQIDLIAVGCNDLWLNDAVSNDLRKELLRKKYSIGLDEIMVMPITLVLKMKEDVRNDIITKATTHLDKIIAKLKTNSISKRNVKFKSKMINLVGKLEDPAARLFGLELHAKKGCISCGICWNRCPENNIKPNKNKIPKFGFSCSMCMRCINECPEKVITPYISKFLTVKGGYDIIE